MHRLLAPASKVWVAVLFMIVAGLSAFLVSTSDRVAKVEHQVVVLNRTVTQIKLCERPAECRMLIDELIAATTPSQARRIAAKIGSPASPRRRHAVTVVVRRLVRRHRQSFRRAARRYRRAAVTRLAPPNLAPPPVLNPAGHAPPGLQPGGNPGHGGCPPGQAKKGEC